MLVTEVTSSNFGLSRFAPGEILQGEKEINQEIFTVCMTSKGTDPFRPDFGCDATKMVDLPINEVKPKMTAAIIESITLFITRIEIDRIISKLVDNSQLSFTIIYTIKNSTNTGQTDITYGLR